MTVRFTWQPEEWREAYRLSTAKPVRRAGSVSMSLIVLGLMVLGGAGDLLQIVSGHGSSILHNSLLRVLAGVAVSTSLIFLWLNVRRRRRAEQAMPQQPEGEQRVVIHESGWRTESGLATEPAPMQAWDVLRGRRVGPHVLALLTTDGSTVGVPLRAMTVDQGNWLLRMVERKVPHRA